MQIKVKNEDGNVTAQLIHPGEERVCSEVSVGPGQEVTFTAINAHSESEIEVGQVLDAEKAPEDAPGDADAAPEPGSGDDGEN